MQQPEESHLVTKRSLWASQNENQMMISMSRKLKGSHETAGSHAEGVHIPSTSPFLSFVLRILHVFTFLSSPVVTSWMSSEGLKDMDVTFFRPCGRSILVFNIQKVVFLSHHHILRYISPRNVSSPSLRSIVAIHSPDDEITTRSTRDGSSIFSSCLDTRFEGDTSSSATSTDDEGEYVCSEDGWEEGRTSVDDKE